VEEQRIEEEEEFESLNNEDVCQNQWYRQALSSGKEIPFKGVACFGRPWSLKHVSTHIILRSSQSACRPVNLGPSTSTPTASPLSSTRSSLSPAQSPDSFFIFIIP
jgi:hypothetical protein